MQERLTVLLFVFVFTFIPAIALANPEPKCFSTCLRDGYYSMTCNAVCEAKNEYVSQYTVANRQYKCFKGCEGKEKTITGCVMECRKQVNEQINADMQSHFDSSIKGAEKVIEFSQENQEKIIESKISSKKLYELRYDAPQVIE